jgi:O-Antigen ligase
MSSRLHVQLAGAIQAVLALFVVSLGVAAGNGPAPWNVPIGRDVRWAALAELVALAVVFAALSPRGRLGRRFELLFAAFLALAVLSALWSADASLTLGRVATLAAVLLTGAALASVVAVRRDFVEVFLLGLVAGVVILALLGLLVLWDDPDRAIVPATLQSAARYNGIGGNPNTIAMLIALVLPAAVWCVLEARGRTRQVVVTAALALLYGSLVASGSRGALLGALLGTIVFALVARYPRRTTGVVVGSAIALFAAGVAVLGLQEPAKRNPVIRFDIVPPPTPPLSPADVQPRLPLESEVGLPRRGDRPFERTLFTSSGRLDAWSGALEQALERPLLGYGFGTEERVFTDRYYLHYSDRPENAYLGTLLQLGFAGFALLLALLAAVAARISRQRDAAAAACAGAVACGLVLAVSQSYLTSVGSPAMAPFWLCALLLVGATSGAARASRGLDERERDEREVDAAERHREAGLHVMGPEDKRVPDQQEDRGAPRTTAQQRDG